MTRRGGPAGWKKVINWAPMSSSDGYSNAACASIRHLYPPPVFNLPYRIASRGISRHQKLFIILPPFKQIPQQVLRFSFFNKNKIVNYLRPATLSEWPMDWRRRRYGVTAGSADWLLTYNAPFILSTYENGARTTKKTDSSSFRRWFALTVHQVNPYVRPLQWIFLIGSSASNGRIRRRLFRVIPSLTPFTKRETGVYRIVVSYRRNARITGSVKGI